MAMSGAPLPKKTVLTVTKEAIFINDHSVGTPRQVHRSQFVRTNAGMPLLCVPAGWLEHHPTVLGNQAETRREIEVSNEQSLQSFTERYSQLELSVLRLKSYTPSLKGKRLFSGRDYTFGRDGLTRTLFLQRPTTMKILLVDDHTLFREGMRLVLSELDPGCQIVEASTCQAAFDFAQAESDFDVVLLDLNLPDMPGFAALSVLREEHPQLPVVVLSASDDRATVLEALDRGAMGFIPKSSSSQVLMGALKLVLAKGVYIPATVLNEASVPVPPAFSTNPAKPIRPIDLGLTERQMDVLGLMVRGEPNKLICRELGLAEGTVKTHVTAVLRALNVTNRTQAVLAVSRLGLTFGK
jgi:DNA-binding NarL/FixJ family response regulator